MHDVFEKSSAAFLVKVYPYPLSLVPEMKRPIWKFGRTLLAFSAKTGPIKVTIQNAEVAPTLKSVPPRSDPASAKSS